VRTDNGPEFSSRAFMAWANTHGIRHILIQPGRPMQNGYIESFNGKFRDEHLTSNGSRPCTRPGTPPPSGGRTATRSGPTAAWAASPRRDSPDFLDSVGTPVGGRSGRQRLKGWRESEVAQKSRKKKKDSRHY
jgi:transposase InsO family protein